MHAIVEFQGRQFRVQEGETIQVPLLEAEPGSAIVIDRVLMIADGDSVTVGHPLVDGATVDAKVLGHGRGPKVIVGKFKRRKDYRRRKGYRDDFTAVEIAGIRGA
ncbi:MAG: 50S ribosomal protein L21 [Candidatus Eisenbacteria bacterium]|nr:50S ribosomal protein L21 [Candidatus Latescibacterota bacterium]MBD3303369.1 50S ribosomal protein L21 [Candidatus Eisenbacteria bacterium]